MSATGKTGEAKYKSVRRALRFATYKISCAQGGGGNSGKQPISTDNGFRFASLYLKQHLDENSNSKKDQSNYSR